MKKDEVLDYMDELKNKNAKLETFVSINKALSSFLADFEYLRESKHLTQKEIAKTMGTTQSAVSRIESYKTNPSYKQLVKLSTAVGGELSLTPMGDMSITVPYDLQDKVNELAESEKKSAADWLLLELRKTIEDKYSVSDVISNCVSTFVQTNSAQTDITNGFDTATGDQCVNPLTDHLAA
jgi:transcriptional regulator with XRE-family HTH domain